MLYFSPSFSVKVRVLASADTSGSAVASAGDDLEVLVEVHQTALQRAQDGDRSVVLRLVGIEGRGLLAKVHLDDLVSCEVGRARGRTLSTGAADWPGAVEAAGGADGAVEVVAPPHAATMTAMLAKMPNSRFCMDSPPNG